MNQRRRHLQRGQGRTVERDISENKSSDLLNGALAILMGDDDFWPTHWDKDITDKIMMQKKWVDKLAVAGAFIAAEIDRFQATEPKPQS